MLRRSLATAMLLCGALAGPATAQSRAEAHATIQVGDILSVTDVTPELDGLSAAGDGQRTVRLLIRANRRWRLLVSVVPDDPASAAAAVWRDAEVRVRSVEGSATATGADTGPRADGMTEVARSDGIGQALVDLELVWPTETSSGSEPAVSLVYTLAAHD